MMRSRRIFAALALAALSADAFAQSTLAERLGFAGQEAATPARAPVHVDPAVKPAAAANPRTPGGNRAPRTSGGGRRGLLGGFNLPSLFGGGDTTAPIDREAGSAGEPPLPYDPAELNNPRPRTAAQSPRPPQGAPRTVAPQTSRAGSVSPMPRTAPAAVPAVIAADAPRQTPRSSPVVADRRNELAEALSGLGAVNASDRSSSAAARTTTPRQSTPRTAASQPPLPAPPVAASDSQLPSYLQDDITPTPRTASARPAPRPQATTAPPRSLDVHDALTRRTAPAGDETSASVQQVPQARPVAPAGATPRQVARSEAPRDIADVLRPMAKAPQPPSTAIGRRDGDNEAGDAPLDSSDAAPAATANANSALPDPVDYAEIGPATPQPTTSAPQPQQAVDAEAEPLVATGPQPQSDANVQVEKGVLVSWRQPMIVSRVEGPSTTMVGRPTDYRVTLKNTGETVASDVIATIQAPASAELIDATATSGVIDRANQQQGETANAFAWQIRELQPGSSQTVTVKVVPREGRPLQLDVHWTHAPAGGATVIQVQEPKLDMQIAGPEDVLFGKAHRYTLTLSNPGTGDAQDVALELLPPGGNEESLVHHRIGLLPAGEKKVIELELTPREAGALIMKAAAVAAGDLRAESVKEVLCRQPQLNVDWRGPKKQYAGAVATYFFRVRNPGTASAEKVEVRVRLPEGAELVDATEGYEVVGDKNMIGWPIAALVAGEEQFLEVSCRFSQAGENRIDLAARSKDGDLTDSKSAAVDVVALADLKLEVIDPKGAVPVGNRATYEIRITNRGQTAARGVNIVAMFSAGIDPTEVEGAPHAIEDGRVAFHAIDALAAGAEAVLRIHATANEPGTHKFRAEVTCDDIDATLAADETTRFFREDARWEDVSTAYSDSDDEEMR